MNSSKLKKNVFFGIIRQLVVIAYGFILPNLILKSYGSTVNGLLSSIKQFLGIITYFEFGVGAVVKSALYKALYNKNNKQISQIITSAQKYYNSLGIGLVFYVLILVILFPIIVKTQFSTLYISILIIACSINYFGQYVFGIVNMNLLQADQHGYIYDLFSIAVYITGCTAGVILIYSNVSIQIIEIVTSLVFMIRPLCLNLYVKKHYSINKHELYEIEPIPQKWNGIAQHICAVVIDGTDVVVLTLFSTLSNVSIYSVYSLIVTGLKTIYMSITNGVSAFFGSIIAKNQLKLIQNVFANFEWAAHTTSIIIFGSTSVLITPFILIYTKGVTDTNYNTPIFALLISIAQMMRCIRLPYNCAILAAGHFKQTQNNYIIASILNIVLSIILVKEFGLIGVTIGTIIAFLYQCIWMASYISKNIVIWPLRNFLNQLLLDILIFVIAYLITVNIPCNNYNYFEWTLNAIQVVFVWVIVSLIINFIFKRDFTSEVFNKIISKIKRIFIIN